jgi:hypothetical protein
LKDFALKVFIASSELPEIPIGFFYMILLTKSPGGPKKLPGSPKEALKTFRAKFFKFFGSHFGKLMSS